MAKVLLVLQFPRYPSGIELLKSLQNCGPQESPQPFLGQSEDMNFGAKLGKNDDKAIVLQLPSFLTGKYKVFPWG